MSNKEEELDIEDMREVRAALSEMRFVGRLMDFAEESNHIENIHNHEANKDAYNRLVVFLALDSLTIQDVCNFNTAGKLRDKVGMDVSIGGHIPPLGCPEMAYTFKDIIDIVSTGHAPFNGARDLSAFRNHEDFEMLHPFTDGSGRTGRAIWLWQMVKQFDYALENGFLKQWYYQSLDARRCM